jgi:AraC family transcriptional regulator
LFIGLSYDDPESTPAEALRYDVCFTVAEPVASLPDFVRLERIVGGRYAVHRLKGSYSGIKEAFRRIFGLWLPASGEALGDRPCREIYRNSMLHVPESELLTDICVPLGG